MTKQFDIHNNDKVKCHICGCDMEYTVSKSGLKEYTCVSCQYNYEEVEE